MLMFNVAGDHVESVLNPSINWLHMLAEFMQRVGQVDYFTVGGKVARGTTKDLMPGN